MKTDKNSKNRVAVFIDHSNVFHRLSETHKIDSQWNIWYNPLELSDKLAGKRDLVGVYFYCSPPPPYLLKEGEKQTGGSRLPLLTIAEAMIR